MLAKADGAAKPVIVVRNAGDDEKFTTLDEKEHELTSDALLIADETKGIALAGIMGGLNSEIAAGTEDVLIECAYFQPQNIRATAKRLGISTDASYRFERGCDPNCCDWVSQRAAQLIIETAGGRLAKGCVDAYPGAAEPGKFRCALPGPTRCLASRFRRTNRWPRSPGLASRRCPATATRRRRSGYRRRGWT